MVDECFSRQHSGNLTTMSSMGLLDPASSSATSFDTHLSSTSSIGHQQHPGGSGGGGGHLSGMMSMMSMLGPAGGGGGGATATSAASSAAMSSGQGGEGDANSALAELDQGLRCGRLGEQCEAIVRFPRLFAKYPFPILINSALLKLADVFRQGSNFVKLCVLRVLQQSERHLDKITNVDDFVKRIFTVFHSNDPVARALTLRTLGAIAVIIPERKQVHHNIRNALDSHDNVELHAAIFAAGKFAAQSKTFAMNMCSKISEMIRGYATPLEMKLKLIPIFQHMHHDAQTAQAVRHTCIDLLPCYPSKDFVMITLHTLTLLAAHTLVDIPDQVELLLQYLNEDVRMAVKKRIIQDLRHLANEDRAHLWSEDNVTLVITFARECQLNGTLVGALSVLCDLIRHTSIEKLELENANAPIIKLCEQACYCTNLPVAARATNLMTLLATNCKRDLHHVEGIDISADAVMAIQSLFLLMNSGSELTNLSTLKECLQSVVMLCRVHPEACDQFVDIIGGMLVQFNEEVLPMMCDLLAALGHMRPGVLKPLLPEICNEMQLIATSQEELKSKERNMTLLATLFFQTLMHHKWTEEAQNAISRCVDSLDAWTLYRVGRNATRFGHHAFASKIFGMVAPVVSSEQLYYWMRGLTQVFDGERILNDSIDSDLVDRITTANSRILLGCSSIKAATTPYRNQEFQINYLQCRSEMLQAMSKLLFACNSLRTSPPPAIASTQAKQSKDDLQRCGRITQLFRQSVKDFSAVGRIYGDLYQGSFDADPDTLHHIQLLQQLNSCISQWIEMVCLRGNLQGTIYQDIVIEFATTKPKEECGVETLSLINTAERIADFFRDIPLRCAPISDVHTDCLANVVTLLSSTPLCFPRFFFQSLQQTSLKLSVTPQPRMAGEPVGVSASQQLAIKVEGVITTSQLSKTWRKVDTILITLSSNLVASSKGGGGSIQNEHRKLPDCNQTLELSVSPHNDFFTAQFLIPFLVAGTHLVTVETQFIDSEKRSWKTGQKVNLSIKAYEDGQNRPSAAARGGSGGQSR